MRVVHIAFQYGLDNSGGAAIAATRLHQALLAGGVESHYFCVQARTAGVNVHVLPQGWRRRLFLLLTKLSRGVWKFTSYRRSVNLNVVPLFGLEAELAKVRPDVVHVQWLNADVASYEQLARLPYRVVFNLHDLFVISALESYPGRDRRFVTGYGLSDSTRLERWVFARKREMVARLRPAFIGPSEWACGECRASLVGRAFPAYAIPNLPDRAFERQGGAEKAAAGGTERFVVLFGAFAGRANPTKGFGDLVRALRLLPPAVKARTELRVFGESAEDCETEGVRTRFVGAVGSPADMVGVYRAADVFAFPSHMETQGLTKVEAMLCGLPVVAFDRSACAEGIEHLRTGWIAPAGDDRAFAAGLSHFYEEWRGGELGRRRKAIADAARGRFSSDGLLKRVIEVYRDESARNLQAGCGRQ